MAAAAACSVKQAAQRCDGGRQLQPQPLPSQILGAVRASRPNHWAAAAQIFRLRFSIGILGQDKYPSSPS